MDGNVRVSVRFSVTLGFWFSQDRPFTTLVATGKAGVTRPLRQSTNYFVQGATASGRDLCCHCARLDYCTGVVLDTGSTTRMLRGANGCMRQQLMWRSEG